MANLFDLMPCSLERAPLLALLLNVSSCSGSLLHALHQQLLGAVERLRTAGSNQGYSASLVGTSVKRSRPACYLG
mgnify:CR=1 FL=1